MRKTVEELLVKSLQEGGLASSVSSKRIFYSARMSAVGFGSHLLDEFLNLGIIFRI